jgi:integral membrane protein (TIGR01906 family)
MKKVYSILSTLITIMIPFFLMMGSIRILINSIYLDYEYNLPNFPADEFGFSTADRLYWGKISLDYLTNNGGIDFLADLKFADGSPFYNERELSHMLDVKNLVQHSLIAWYIVIGVLVTLGIWSWVKKWWELYLRGISRGGLLTIFVIIAVLLATFIDFDALFTQFHHLFFTADTWLFYTSDSLIRLFPEKLWTDAFMFMGIFTLASAVILMLVGSRFKLKK